jgi:hypothetical protein
MTKDEKPQQLTLWFSYEIRVEPKAPESVIELEAFTLVGFDALFNNIAPILC